MKSENTILEPTRGFSKDDLLVGIRGKKRVKKVRNSIASLLIVSMVTVQLFSVLSAPQTLDLIEDPYTLSETDETYYSQTYESEDTFWDSFDEFIEDEDV